MYSIPKQAPQAPRVLTRGSGKMRQNTGISGVRATSSTAATASAGRPRGVSARAVFSPAGGPDAPSTTADFDHLKTVQRVKTVPQSGHRADLGRAPAPRRRRARAGRKTDFRTALKLARTEVELGPWLREFLDAPATVSEQRPGGGAGKITVADVRTDLPARSSRPSRIQKTNLRSDSCAASHDVSRRSATVDVVAGVVKDVAPFAVDAGGSQLALQMNMPVDQIPAVSFAEKFARGMQA